MKAAKAETKVTKRKGVALTEKQMKRKANKEKKLKKDPNKPKRPPSPFFVFLNEFRVQYMKDHPNTKAVSVVGKAAGEKWKSMSEADKVPYVAKAEKLKGEYEKKMTAYNNKDAGDVGGPASAEESEKSKSEVNDEDEQSEDED
eukprot:TRINITY_DN3127_c0_g1_i1.p1 TRINITY_DN3127_c0_g1~~TRINITY_DN3127_c0_g1_i1.p1  ORF type:complete len:144 (-),score=42.65 TRINITY_DN3127_c0_g1_i1:279-710(-)